MRSRHFFGVKVKIIPDDLVQLDKGTGAVMCCTFGDETDIRWWKKHNLNLRVMLRKDGICDSLYPLKENSSLRKISFLHGMNKSDSTRCGIGREECVDLLNFQQVYDEIVAH